jgi:leucyl/phenylalanyl-tRNA---protein transferase
MPDPRSAPAEGLVAAGGDLEPGTILSAYRSGIFPWPDREGRILWWSPDPRAILPLDSFHESRSLRRRRRSGPFQVTVDRAFAAVLAGCADRPEGTWITAGITHAYRRLHRLGWAHSIEVWNGERLVGGLYGVAMKGFFAAESMFHRERDASKVALAELVERLVRLKCHLLDVQFRTTHLESLGAVEVSRQEYLGLLDHALGAELSSAAFGANG